MKNYLNQTDKTVEDELHDECGVFGAYDFDGNDVASTIYYGLFALQHRGQESCGIAVRSFPDKTTEQITPGTAPDTASIKKRSPNDNRSCMDVSPIAFKMPISVFSCKNIL